MNNIIYHNIIRKMGKRIKKEQEESKDIVKNGYLCTEDCWIRKMEARSANNQKRICGKRKFCDWDLRSNFWKGADTSSKRKY